METLSYCQLMERCLVAEARVAELEETLTTHAVAWTSQDALDDSICGSTAMMGPFNVVGDIPLIAKPQLPPKEV